ncbi:spore coat protein [Clostridium formicaceticum]|uniref:Spore coat protein n=1 Tax=Clostridium formicaceticum TaxID=1497 RepID=A0AAC9WH43_9CLOT|nr:spore coat protein [Clostridium formicaceticum]AOY77913.1 spore coat protein [Clostridium formicaceticum]ARE88531.1 Spore coat protein F precursor [Clostridium formicaceticum]
MNILQNLAGMGDMTEQVIATDFLLAIKSTVRNYAIALSETTTPEVREVLRRHLEVAINTHESMLKYMQDKGYYHVHDPQEQMKVDMKNANNALNLQR